MRGLQFVRTTSSYANWAPAIVGFAMWAKWRQLATVLTADSIFTSAMLQLALDLTAEGIRVAVQVQFRAGAFDVGELGRVAAAHLRVVFVMAYSVDVVTVALAAKDQGMLEASWAWLGLDTVAGAETFAAGSKSVNAAKAALHGWVYFQPSNVAPAAFFARARTATHALFPLQPGSDEAHSTLSTPFAAKMYDAVVLFAMAATANSSQLLNGVPTFEAMTSVSFDGMTGRVELDANGDMKESISAVNYVLWKDGTIHGEQIGVADGLGHRFSPLGNGTMVWPGGAHVLPADSAEAQAEQGFNTAWLLLGASAAALVLMTGLVILVRKRHSHLQAILNMLLTEMSMLVLSICTALANLSTDGIVFGRLLRGDLKVSSEIYTAAYATILCFGVVATALSLGYRIRNARLVNAQLKLLAPQAQAQAASEAQRKSQQHEWELMQIHRSKVSLMLSLASVAAQGVLAPRTSASSHSRVTVFRCALQICRCQS
jgi:hypothetical protein